MKTNAELTQLINRVFVLGQDWWREADSESHKQNKKADETQAKFEAVRAEILAVLQPSGDVVSVPMAKILKMLEQSELAINQHFSILTVTEQFNYLRATLSKPSTVSDGKEG